jgi:hypothetical protein
VEATGGGLFYAIFFGFDFPGTEKKVAGKWIYRKKSGRIRPYDHLQKAFKSDRIMLFWDPMSKK